MAFLKNKKETPFHYKPVNKKGQKIIVYGMIAIIVLTLLYILSFYLFES